MRVLKSTHKGKEVFICTGPKCGCVVENLNPTEYFPEGYHYDTCPKCHHELDYTNPIIIEKTVL
jgi:hypothetical protein